jgi:hypothetical protein
MIAGVPARGRAIAALVLLLGVTAAVAQVVLVHTREDLIERELAHRERLADVQAGITETHLWIEELVAGESLPSAQVHEGVARARRGVAAMLAGEAAPGGPRPIRDSRLRRDVESLGRALADFDRAGRAREAGHHAGDAVAAGSPAW